MALPYGPIMRGLRVSWCFERVEEGLSALENPSEAKVFAARTRVVARERLDPRSSPLSQGPTATLHVGEIVLANARGYGGREILYSRGIITHTGTGTSEVSLEGPHSGNNRYGIVITGSGTVGADGEYELAKTPWTGSEWGTPETVSEGGIPVTGRIAVGNGSTFVFQLGEGVVDGDEYTWETEAYRIANAQVRDAIVPVTAAIEAANEEEVVGDGGYLDQLMLMFARKRLSEELYTDHYEEVTEEMSEMTVTPSETTCRLDVTLKYRGKVFMADVSPLVTLVSYDEPEIVL